MECRKDDLNSIMGNGPPERNYGPAYYPLSFFSHNQ